MQNKKIDPHPGEAESGSHMQEDHHPRYEFNGSDPRNFCKPNRAAATGSGAGDRPELDETNSGLQGVATQPPQPQQPQPGQQQPPPLPQQPQPQPEQQPPPPPPPPPPQPGQQALPQPGPQQPPIPKALPSETTSPSASEKQESLTTRPLPDDGTNGTHDSNRETPWDPARLERDIFHMGASPKLHDQTPEKSVLIEKHPDRIEANIVSLALRDTAFMEDVGRYVCHDRHTGEFVEDFVMPMHNAIFLIVRDAFDDLRDAGFEKQILNRQEILARIQATGNLIPEDRLPAMQFVNEAFSKEPDARLDRFVREHASEWLARRRLVILNAKLKRLVSHGLGKSRIRDLFERALEPIPEPLQARLRKNAFDIDQVPPSEPARYSLAGVEICHPGNLAVITGPPKSCKSSFMQSFIASPIAIADEGNLLGLSAPSNDDGLALIHIDTEQSRGDHYTMVRTALRRANVERPPGWFYSYNLSGWEPKDVRDVIEVELQRCRKRHGGVFAVLIDGIGDLVKSPNDEEESFEFVRRLHELAIEFQTVFVVVLHVNPGADKTRGHLGSQLDRKAETVLRLEKDSDDVVTVYARYTRGGTIPKKRAPRFAWDTDKHRHVLLGAEETQLGKLIIGLAELDSISTVQCTSKELLSGIEKIDGCSRKTAEKRICDLMDAKLIERKSRGIYVWSEKGLALVGSRETDSSS